MTRRPTQKTGALVLRFLDYGESDRIVTFYTERFGKLKGIAKGARRSRKRFANALELCTLLDIFFSRKSRDGLSLIEGCDVITHYPAMRETLEASMAALYVIELVDHFTVEGKRNLPLFRLTQDVLGLLEGGTHIEETLRIFELRLLKLSGYDPFLEQCGLCMTPLDKMTAPSFHAATGGVRCRRCTGENGYSVPVSVGTLKTLLLGKTIDIDKIPRLAFSERTLKESSLMLGTFIRHILGKELKSLRVLNQFRLMGI